MEKVEQTECAEIFCEKEVTESYVFYGHKKYCSLRCMATDMGAVEIVADDK